MKSFSELTKEEILREENLGSCCDSAELLGLLLFGCAISKKEIKFTCENRTVFERFNFLAQKHKVKRSVFVDLDKSRYTSIITNEESISILLKKFELIDARLGVIRYRAAEKFVAKDCCIKAFIKGAFSGAGTIIDPKKNYSLEFVTAYLGLKESFIEILNRVGFSFKQAVRKSKYVIYSKQSETITDFLSYLGAFNAQMELINIKIEKEIKNNFNRAANSEAANIGKAIDAAVKQILAISIIDQNIGIDELPDELKSLARLRLEHRSLSLLEIGKLLNPPLSKSAVNRRFTKMIKMAENFEKISKE